MKSALVLYYSFTGEAARSSELMVRELRRAGVDATVGRVDFSDPALRLQRPLKVADVKRWTAAAQSGESFPVIVEPASAVQRRYDLVCIVSNTWQHHPSVPIRSLFALPAVRSLLHDTPFAVLVVCRRSWKRNLEIVRSEAEECGGRFVGSEHVEHRGSQVGSLIRTVTYLLSAGGTVARWRGWRLPLPEYGLAEEMLARCGGFARGLAATLSAPPSVPLSVSPSSPTHGAQERQERASDVFEDRQPLKKT